MKNEIEKLRKRIRNIEKKLEIEKKGKKEYFLVLPLDYREYPPPLRDSLPPRFICLRCGEWKWEHFKDEDKLKARCINCGHIYGES